MTVVTRRDLSPGYQLAQTGHAIAEFIFAYPKDSQRWHKESKFLICLSTEDESSLQNIISKLTEQGIKHAVFREPDLDNQITAVAIDPSANIKHIVSSLPLALKECTNKNNLKQQAA